MDRENEKRAEVVRVSRTGNAFCILVLAKRSVKLKERNRVSNFVGMSRNDLLDLDFLPNTNTFRNDQALFLDDSYSIRLDDRNCS